MYRKISICTEELFVFLTASDGANLNNSTFPKYDSAIAPPTDSNPKSFEFAGMIYASPSPRSDVCARSVGEKPLPDFLLAYLAGISQLAIRGLPLDELAAEVDGKLFTLLVRDGKPYISLPQTPMRITPINIKNSHTELSARIVDTSAFTSKLIEVSDADCFDSTTLKHLPVALPATVSAAVFSLEGNLLKIRAYLPSPDFACELLIPLILRLTVPRLDGEVLVSLNEKEYRVLIENGSVLLHIPFLIM